MTAAQSVVVGPEGEAGPATTLDLGLETEGPAVPASGVGPITTPAPQPRVIGLDLSLRSTGVAGGSWALTITGPKLPDDAPLERHWARLRHMRARLLEYIDSAHLVVLEAPSYGSNDPGSHERAWLWWAVAGRCFAREVPLATVAPNTLKVYATGNGRAKKEDVVQHVQKRRPDVEFRGNDQADALVLAAMGLDHLGHPPVALPQTHRRALASVRWPAVSA